jgi:CheY-like chemotaxis protein
MEEIQERRLIERQLVAATHIAEDANNAKSAFLAVMSHEIRTPLTGILGFAQLLADSGLDPIQASYVDIIARSGQNLTRLLNDILDLSKVEAGRLRIEKAPFFILAIIRDTLTLIEQRSQLTSQHISRSLPVALERVQVVGDAGRIQQILSNIIDNALKFSNGQPVSLSVRAKDLGSTLDLVIAVADHGPGVPDHLKAEIFQPYVTTPNAGPSGPGAGLGLAVSARLANAMGGTLAVLDREGGGSIFEIHLTLPILQTGSDDAKPESEPANSGPVLSILLADDDEVNRLLVSTLLTRMNHEVTSVANGRDALDMAVTARFDAVFMDIRMPIMDGVEAIELIRASGVRGMAALPIFAMTANIMDSEVRHYLAVGANSVISKPINRAELAAALEFAATHKITSQQQDN